MTESRIWTTRHLRAQLLQGYDSLSIHVWDRQTSHYLGTLYKMPDLSLEYMNEWAEIIDCVTKEIMAASRKLKRGKK